MKITIGQTAFFLLLVNSLTAQTLVVDSRFGATYTHEQGDLIMTSTLGPPIPSTDYQNNLAVLTDHIHFPVSVDTTSNHDLAPLQGIHIYPNPTPDVLIVNRDDPEDALSVEVYSTSGQVLQKLDWEKGIQSVQLSFNGMPAGLYMVSITDPLMKRRTTYKIQKR